MSNRCGPITPDRFMRHVLRGDDCWLWTGSLNNKGYPQVGDDGKTRSAHRVAHELFIGPIPAGLTVDHTCHNDDATCPGGPSCLHRRCVNPAHLEAVTGTENKKRGKRLAWVRLQERAA